ncbi:MAG: hypothetical protein LBF56_00055 [Holosporales bacterium]|nr:hypothetical protein [Holosporales bacterium]
MKKKILIVPGSILAAPGLALCSSAMEQEKEICTPKQGPELEQHIAGDFQSTATAGTRGRISKSPSAAFANFLAGQSPNPADGSQNHQLAQVPTSPSAAENNRAIFDVASPQTQNSHDANSSSAPPPPPQQEQQPAQVKTSITETELPWEWQEIKE